ncbi:MAG: hypothetical protein Q4G63_06700 [Bacteroidia bacterium]|nr:hypothetical protein [Bacteroidia bacterium]
MKKKATFQNNAAKLPLLSEPAMAYHTRQSVLNNLSAEYISTLSDDEINDLSNCITGEELEARVIARLEKRIAAKSCK